MLNKVVDKKPWQGSAGKKIIGKSYAPKPEKLTIVCPHCQYQFAYCFSCDFGKGEDAQWHKELEGIECVKCGRKRIEC